MLGVKSLMLYLPDQLSPRDENAWRDELRLTGAGALSIVAGTKEIGSSCKSSACVPADFQPTTSGGGSEH